MYNVQESHNKKRASRLYLSKNPSGQIFWKRREPENSSDRTLEKNIIVHLISHLYLSVPSDSWTFPKARGREVKWTEMSFPFKLR